VFWFGVAKSKKYFNLPAGVELGGEGAAEGNEGADEGNEGAEEGDAPPTFMQAHGSAG